MNKEMKNKIEEANSIATERILKSIPVLVDVKPAIEAHPKHEKEFDFACRSPNRMEKNVWTNEGRNCCYNNI